MAGGLFAYLLSTVLSLTSFTIAEEKPVTSAPRCGAPGVKFDVKIEKEQHPPQQEAGKALVYFIQDDSEYLWKPRPTTRLGVDGDWIGATHGGSYFYFSATPGIHHLCASWQTGWQSPQIDRATAALHFTAEAGGVYYFGVKDRIGMSFYPFDSDEGQLLVNHFMLSTSHARK